MKLFERALKFLASLQLAMIVMACLGVLAATGTILEARYDANYAQKMVYQSPYMFATLALLCINLFNVMLDRWPWKAHHAGFVLAHIGIITLIVGSWVTHRFGVDGSLAFEIGQANRYVMLSSSEFVVARSLGEGRYDTLHKERVDFLLHPIEKNPISVMVDGQQLEIVDYYNYAVRESKLVQSDDDLDGPAVRVQLQNARVNMSQWIKRPATAPTEEFNLGPARIVLAAENAPFVYTTGNVLVFRPSKTPDKLSFEIYTQSLGGLSKKGLIAVVDEIDTGWMGIKLRLLKYLPHAREAVDFLKREQPTGATMSAIKIRFAGKDYWSGLNGPVRIHDGATNLVAAYRNELLDIGFDMRLEKFEVGRYLGSTRAKTYQSEVNVPDLGNRLISMNNPLKYNDYTFYQASFQENAQGKPTTSILSVNHDPGRWMKYLGSLLMVLGTIVMFYFKKYRLKIWGPTA